MSDNYNTLTNRLLSRAPVVGPILAGQLINDSWHTLQARQEWSWRRRSGTFAPPTVYQAGSVSTNVASGFPTLITGSGTAWTPQMVGRQIRLGGLMYPYYTIVAYNTPTQILIDQPWAGPDISAQPYQILQCFYPVPGDFGYFYSAVSIKDGFRLWTNVTENELNLLDPQRTNSGQTYAIAYKDFTAQLAGTVGSVIPVTSPIRPGPISGTFSGFTYPADATFIIQVVTSGDSGAATYQWLRAGQLNFQPAVITSNQSTPLSDGVEIYWPDGVSYTAGDLFILNCTAFATQGVPRYELWPAPTFNGYLYSYIYIVKEYDISATSPTLPPFVANRGELLLEMALEKCATFPGADIGNPNPYYSLQLAKYHAAKVEDMLIEFCNNDQNVGIDNISYANYPMAPAPWDTGSWQQSHSPYLVG